MAKLRIFLILHKIAVFLEMIALCLNNHNFFKLGAFGELADEKVSKALQLFNFLLKNLTVSH
jgi:hypothetical protein